MLTRRAVLFAALPMLVVLPGAAQAQNLGLDADRSCYGAGQVIALDGWGFTPDGDVALSAGGQQLGVGAADYDGIFSATMRAPALPFPEAELRFTATDQTYLLNRASVDVTLTSLGVSVTPAGGDPAQPRRIRARGFFGGRVLYAHVRRAGRVRNLRVGRLTGACRTLNTKRRLFPAGVDPGAYSLSFDTDRRFSAGGGTARITYAVKIARRGGAHTSGVARSERWTLLAR